jgi:3-dehydroquinate synthase class II
MATIMSDAMSMLDKETLKREQEKGIQPLTNLIGMIADKALKMENIKLQHENAKLKHEILDKTRQVIFVDDEDEYKSDNLQLS